MENIIDVVAISDTHGYLPEITTPFDLMLVCGDICPAHDHYFAYQINWFQHEFAQWINTLPFKNEWSRVVITWGNHDFVGERITKEHLNCFYISVNNKAIVLRNEEAVLDFLTEDGIKNVSLFGTPYCKIFGYWAFMLSDESLRRKYAQVPEDCDFLLTHDAPDINNLGLISMGTYSGVNAGNVVLADAIKEKKPKVALCGHIHSGNHNLENIDGTWMANVSYVNEGYRPAHKPLCFKYNVITREVIV